MAGSSNNSFIPKRGTTKNRRSSNTRQVYVFTFLSYIFLFATLITSAGSYFYGTHVEKKLAVEVSLLNSEISSFNEADMQRVLDFDRRLSQASSRLDTTVSLVSVFQALEEATINNVLIDSLLLERQGDSLFTLVAGIETDSFDATLFQRGIYQRNQTVSSVIISDVTTSDLDVNPDTLRQADQSFQRLPTVSFTAEFKVPLSRVSYNPGQNNTIVTPVFEAAVPEVDLLDEASSTIGKVDEINQLDNNENI
jgi:hypothetical protein